MHCSSKIAEFMDIPIPIMTWLIDEAQLLVSLLDIPFLQPGDVEVAHTLLIQQFQMDTECHNMWTPVVLNWLKHIILWFQSNGHTFGECPNANALCTDMLCIIPENFAKCMINDEHDADAHMSYIPARPLQLHYAMVLINWIKLYVGLPDYQ